MPFAKGQPRPKGAGRTAGKPNKVTGELKDMILKALDGAGGIEYLQKQAEENPGPFLTLVGKVLPMTINGEGKDGKIEIGLSWVRDRSL